MPAPETEREVYNFLSTHGPQTANTLQEQLGIPQQTLSRVLLKLANAGTVSVLSFPQKLYTVKHKPNDLKALLATMLCTTMKLHDAYDAQSRLHGTFSTDAKLIEALRAEMHRWTVVINAHEDTNSGGVA